MQFLDNYWLATGYNYLLTCILILVVLQLYRLVSVSGYIIDYKNITRTVYKRVEEKRLRNTKDPKGGTNTLQKSRLDFFGYKEGVKEQFLKHGLIHYIHFSFKLSFADSYSRLSSLNGHSRI